MKNIKRILITLWLSAVFAILLPGVVKTAEAFQFASRDIPVMAATKSSKPSKPKASSKSGTYYVTSHKYISLTCSTKGADIFYSKDGENFKKYTKKIKLTGTTVLYAYAQKNGAQSKTVKYKYSLKVKLSDITPKEGTYEGETIVKLSTSAKNVTMYYTLNGKKPSPKSALYKGNGITIKKSCTLRVLIKKDGFTDRYITKEYTIVPLPEPEKVPSEDFDDTTFAGTSDAQDEKAAPDAKSDAQDEKATSDAKSDTQDEKATSDGKSDTQDKKATPDGSAGIQDGKAIPDGSADTQDGKTVSDMMRSRYGYTDMSVLENRTYYNLLSNSEKELYRRMYEALSAHQASSNISDLNISSNQLKKVFCYIIGESPELFWVNDGSFSWYESVYVTDVDYEYTNTEQDANTRKAKLEKKADEMIASAEDNSNDLFGFIKELHDNIIQNAVYDLGTGETRNTAGTDDIILDGHGLCTAYSRAFMYLLHRAGINCIMVGGKANNGYSTENHNWNKALLDGEWYAFDVTWDDPTNSHYGEVVDYSYFGLAEDRITADHYMESIYEITSLKCTGTKYNYYNYYGITVYSDAYTACEALFSEVSSNFSKGIYRTSVICDSAETALRLYNMTGDRLSYSYTCYERGYELNGCMVSVMLIP